jgi:hypothetical protein
VLNVPVPQVYAYSLNPLNSVGAEYILEEKARGKLLGGFWYQLDTEIQLGLVSQLVDLEIRLASVSFSRHGCIYFKKDLDKKGLRFYNLDGKLISADGSMETFSTADMDEFVLGPLIEGKLWEDGRATMDLDRGPCKFPFNQYVLILTYEREQPSSLYGCDRDK